MFFALRYHTASPGVGRAITLFSRDPESLADAESVLANGTRGKRRRGARGESVARGHTLPAVEERHAFPAAKSKHALCCKKQTRFPLDEENSLPAVIGKRVSRCKKQTPFPPAPAG